MFVQIFASSACTGVVCTIGAAKRLEQLGHHLPRACADAADDARQRVDLLEEPARGDPLGRVCHEHVLADVKAAMLGQVAGHELGRSRRDGRAQDQRVPGREHPEQVVQRRADVAHVDLDVRERRRAERDHDVARAGGVGDAL